MGSVVDRNVVMWCIPVLYAYRERRYAGNESDKLKIQQKQRNCRLKASDDTADRSMLLYCSR